MSRKMTNANSGGCAVAALLMLGAIGGSMAAAAGAVVRWL